ncbi:GNAT family N-acetyltransferase [Thermobifida halotolerans]|uniref:GNAT family N-acetyltransferase n=1 Tax=Thermobifida halotolerans TaxID=483545 RepID=A0AA97LTG7_9ACTN|nr:GNAT family N-acetyltransferase [Thermobifida halotolerans]UOE17737.1 GNAT family N-acetyltransferase [Thermobifida halotolerans]
MGLILRHFRPADAPAVLDLSRHVTPRLVDTAVAFRERVARLSSGGQARFVVAELDGAVVGHAAAEPDRETPLPGQGVVNVVVAPHHRRRGVGSALLRTAEKHVVDSGGVVLRTVVQDTPESVRFAEQRGYARRSSTRFQELDLAALPPVPPPPEGARLCSYRDFRSDPRSLHAVEEVAARDEPFDIPYGSPSYPEWLAAIWRNPLLDLDLSTAVVVDDRPVCVVTLLAEGPAVYSVMTGTSPGHRGRGLARYAKSAALHRARERGFRVALTGNAEENAPMLAVNEWLGYRTHAREFLYTKSVRPPGSRRWSGIRALRVLPAARGR